MNIIKMNCPCCGTILTFADNVSEIKCDNCGQLFPICDKTSETSRISEAEVATTSSNIDNENIKKEMQLQANKRESGLRIGVLILVFVVLLTILMGVAANRNNNARRYTSPYSPGTRSAAQSNSDTLTDAQINQLVANALISEIDRKYDTADPGSCTMRINRIDRSSNSNYILVYGSVTLYDIYGRTTTGWSDGSGTAFRSFEVKISKTNHQVSDCDIR